MELDNIIMGAVYGEGTLKLGEIKNITYMDNDIDPDVSFKPYCSFSNQKEFTADLSADLSADFQRIIHTVSSSYPSNFQVEGLINRIQKRKHKKHRINKKWAKKYGYWDVILKGKLNPDMFIGYSEDENVQWQGTVDNIEVVVKDV